MKTFVFFMFIWLIHLSIYAQGDKDAGGLNIDEDMQIKELVNKIVVEGKNKFRIKYNFLP